MKPSIELLLGTLPEFPTIGPSAELRLIWSRIPSAEFRRTSGVSLVVSRAPFWAAHQKPQEIDPSAVDAASFFFGFLHFFFVFFVSGTGERGELVWTIGGSKDDTDDDIARIVDGWVAAGEVDFASPSLSSSPPSSTSRMAATLLWRVVAGMSPLKLKDGAVGHKECVVLWLGIPSSKSNHDSTSPSLSLRGFEMTSCRVLQAPGSSMCGRAAAAEDPAPLILGNTTGVKDEDDIDDAGELSSYLARDMSGGGLPMNSLKLLLLVFAP
eukprot:CAMPEP_0171799764 /NCGR_PEP_ID=MMETSP0991-20121206/71288_1 /TAXON_ID=483369 /ORGANISM="non described non described, Strain CCMP2098" /LENGTH=267 /DNA_ID=CAMNT_0012411165 /DNA_START=218 /DNA_END=1018 /DNA_ORIENTATION=+